MAYYRDSVTRKSWQFLQKLKEKHDFVLIGGWAVWLYCEELKSKDIDIVVDLKELGRLKSEWEMEKNERLKKYQFSQGEVEVDVYVTYYSAIGILAEKIIKDVRLVKGFKVPSCELLVGLKSVAWLSRRGSAKGRKDFIDIVALLKTGECSRSGISKWRKEKKIDEGISEVKREIKLITELMELRINKHQWAKLKGKLLKLLC